MTDYAGNVISNAFDVRGNKTASSDPDMGSWSYAYDALGELLTQTDAKSQTTTQRGVNIALGPAGRASCGE